MLTKQLNNSSFALYSCKDTVTTAMLTVNSIKDEICCGQWISCRPTGSYLVSVGCKVPEACCVSSHSPSEWCLLYRHRQTNNEEQTDREGRGGAERWVISSAVPWWWCASVSVCMRACGHVGVCLHACSHKCPQDHSVRPVTLGTTAHQRRRALANDQLLHPGCLSYTHRKWVVIVVNSVTKFLLDTQMQTHSMVALDLYLFWFSGNIPS